MSTGRIGQADTVLAHAPDLVDAVKVNLARRHLSKGQKAIIAAEAAAVWDKPLSAIASDSGTSKARIAYAATVLAHAPDLVDAVKSGATPPRPYWRSTLVSAVPSGTRCESYWLKPFQFLKPAGVGCPVWHPLRGDR